MEDTAIAIHRHEGKEKADEKLLACNIVFLPSKQKSIHYDDFVSNASAISTDMGQLMRFSHTNNDVVPMNFPMHRIFPTGGTGERSFLSYCVTFDEFALYSKQLFNVRTMDMK